MRPSAVAGMRRTVVVVGAIALTATIALAVESSSTRERSQGATRFTPDDSPPSGLGWAVMRPTSSGAHLYVSPSGEDANDGSRARPWRTVAHAAANVRGGSTVHVAPGVYRGPVKVTADGSPTGRIRFVSTTRWGARIRAVSSRGPVAVVWITGDYVDFEGFDVSGGGEDGSVGIINVGDYVRAIGNYVHHMSIPCSGSRGGAGISFDGGQADYRSHDQAAIGNVVERVGPGPRDGSCRVVHGIYMGARRGIAANNVLIGNAGDGITSWHGARDLRIANNTSVGNGGHGITVGSGGPGNVTGNRDSLVTNNIAVDNKICGITESSDGHSPRPRMNRYRNNLIFGNRRGGNPCETFSLDWAGTIAAEPRFVHRFGKDFRVRTGSPAVDTGTSRGAPAYDFERTRRPKGAGIDRGAYER